MLARDLYIADDPELARDSLRAMRLMAKFNQRPTLPASGDASSRSFSEQSARAPRSGLRFYCDYGYQIQIGARTFVNFGLVALDVATITIDDDVQIGPNVQLLTPTHPVEAEPLPRQARRAEITAWRRWPART
jgi:maltose O-acetyltransferase